MHSPYLESRRKRQAASSLEQPYSGWTIVVNVSALGFLQEESSGAGSHNRHTANAIGVAPEIDRTKNITTGSTELQNGH
jgi:hypothetical protein